MNINAKEQIVREVNLIGNGAHIFAPKEWANEKVLVVRLEKKSIKEELLGILYPYLDKIIAVLIYGSYARKEETKDSDVDVLVITKEKFKIEKNNKFQIIVLAEEEIDNAIRLNPILMYSIFKEASAVINSGYLELLKKQKIDYSFFSAFIKSSCDSLKSSIELFELDKKTGKTTSNSIIYSLILRLRGIFIIESLTKNRKYSNSLFKKWVLNNCKISYEKIYSIYQAVRDNKKIKDETPLSEGEILIEFLEKKIKGLVKKLKNKK